MISHPKLCTPPPYHIQTTAIGAEGELQGLVTSIAQMLLPPPGKKSAGTSESGGAAAGVAHAGTGDDADTLTPGQGENVSGCFSLRVAGGRGEGVVLRDLLRLAVHEFFFFFLVQVEMLSGT